MTVTFFAGRAPRSARLVHFFCFLACWACLALMSVSAHAGAFEDALRAANDGDTATMQQLLGRGLDPDSSDADGNTLLMLAARGGTKGWWPPWCSTGPNSTVAIVLVMTPCVWPPFRAMAGGYRSC